MPTDHLSATTGQEAPVPRAIRNAGPTSKGAPRSRSVRDASVRAALLALALAVSLISPAAVSAPVVALAVLLVAERLVRLRRRGALDAVLVGLAGTAGALMLLGLALNVLPGGLTKLSWTVGAAILGVAALAISSRYPLLPSPFPAKLRSVQDTTWIFSAAALVVLAVAVTLSARIVHQVDVPPLQISAATTSPGHVQLTISSGTTESGLSVVTDAGAARTVAASGLTVGPEDPATVALSVPASGRVRVDLVDAAGKTIRQLILDPATTSRSGS